MSIILVGELHLDPDGYKRATRILEHYNPQKTGIEIDPRLFDKELEQAKRQRQLRKDPQALEKEIKEGWDKTTAEHYLTGGYNTSLAVFDYLRRREEDKVYCLDVLTAKVQETMQMDQTTDVVGEVKDELFASTLEQLRNEQIEKYEQAPKKAIEEGYLELWDVLARDAHAERTIRMLGEGVYFFGIDHIYGAYHNLYERLEYLKPERMMLCDADKL
ncbi:MAG: hypothetical protein JW724_06295 [Candidatus Altiarchaeota archaeon]|nr:hypothetical protein [Candidatus Altiarchaeota archaeon]